MQNLEVEALRLRLIDLEREVKSMREAQEVLRQLSNFGPVVVDLRIKGVVQPVCLFARTPQPEPTTTPFTIVPK